MSGIAGLFHFDGRPVHQRQVQSMLHALSHRGGDGAGLWAAGPTGLAQQALHTTPEAVHERQPLVTRHAVLVADARLDNRADLMRALGWSGRAQAGVGDDALILGAYERWGTACLDHLLGAFAFALWDAHQSVLFCARDHLGIRPFYYHVGPGCFAFGSEAKAILALPEIPRRLCEVRAADYVTLMVDETEATFYDGIVRLPPAHYALVSPDGVRLQRYWQLDPGRDTSLGTDTAYADAYRTLFEEAVSERLRSAVPFGTLLSGGLDSSAITSVARACAGASAAQPLDTFSLVFDEVKGSDERPYIDLMLDGGGLRPHFVRGDRLDVLEDLDRMLWHQDEPFFGPNLFLHWGLYETARRQGIRVLLDGLLGDSVVWHGGEYLTELVATGRWGLFLREARRAAGARRRQARAIWRMASTYALAPFVVSPLRDLARRLSGLPLQASPRSSFLNPDFARHIRWRERAEAFGADRRAVGRSVRAAHYAELTSGLLPIALEVVDKATAAFGIEARYPFADRRLMTFCLSLPAEQRYRAGQTRFIAREAMKGLLPEAVRTRRTKGDLGQTFEFSLRTLAREKLDSLMLDRLDLARPFLNVVEIRKAYQRFMAGQPAPSMLIWQAAVLTRWLELEREGGARAPLPFTAAARERADAAEPHPLCL